MFHFAVANPCTVRDLIIKITMSEDFHNSFVINVLQTFSGCADSRCSRYGRSQKESSHWPGAQKCWAPPIELKLWLFLLFWGGYGFFTFVFFSCWCKRKKKQFVYNELWPEYFLKFKPSANPECWKRLLESCNARNSTILPNFCQAWRLTDGNFPRGCGLVHTEPNKWFPSGSLHCDWEK